jgi:hypothetical protein
MGLTRRPETSVNFNQFTSRNRPKAPDSNMRHGESLNNPCMYIIYLRTTFQIHIPNGYRDKTEKFIKFCTAAMLSFYFAQTGCSSSITSIKSLLFCMTTFSASLTNLGVLLSLWRDCSCYVSRPILAPPPLWLQKHTDLRAHEFAHSPDL